MSITLSSPLYLEMYSDSHQQLSEILLTQLKYYESKYYDLNITISEKISFKFVTKFRKIKFNDESPVFESLKFCGIKIFIESISMDYVNKLVIVNSIPENNNYIFSIDEN